MNFLKMEEEWIQKILPMGLSYPTSTLISGPGGTGKPLVEFAFVSSWLKSGGSAIAIPLQYPNMDFLITSMKKLYNIDLKNYQDKIAMIQFDPNIDEYEILGNNLLKANLLKPKVWKEVVEIADGMVNKNDLGTMVFGSALNLLLFSPTYKEKVVKNIENIIKNDKSKTYIFSVSTSAYADEIKTWEKMADNLMYTRMEKPAKLYFKIVKMKEVEFSKKEISVPISEKELIEIKKLAESTREKIIPEIMNF